MVRKEVKKVVKKKLYLQVLQSIKKENCLPKNISRQKLNHYLKPLKANNLINKKGYATWELTEMGKKYLLIPDFDHATSKVRKRSKKISNDTIRSHAYIFKVAHKKRYATLRMIERGLKIHKIDYKTLQKGELQAQIKGHKVTIGKNNVVIYMSGQYSYFSKCPITNDKYAKQDAKSIILSLAAKLGLKLQDQIKCVRKHHAQVGNEFAVKAKETSQTFTISMQGEEWLSIDASNGIPEMEAISSTSSTADMKNVIQPFMNTLRQNPQVLTAHDEQLRILQENVMALNQLLFRTDEKTQSLNTLNYIQ